MKNNILLVKYNYFFILNHKNKYYFFISIKKKILLINISKYIYIDIIFINFQFFSKNNLNLKIINYFFYSWKKFLIKKIKIRHKVSGLKIYIRNYIRINYGFSYNLLIPLTLYIFKRKKFIKINKIHFWDINPVNIYNFTSTIKNIQSISQYSLKGFRFSKQKFIKRIGKVSKYMDFKSKLF